ncbi:hypothetical protein AMK68_04925 [candidate division KD3-62 bacterium DG_56]|uniref:Uncharacterized protein n=1 Tax=candidate division KD3-62 bacterium DG_56 TaxID=1704032 RepID=A0A0S7XIX7_9BACT|nr:MAG: hypothetical protein AMK68_04925 [candidate division KD3-62 bacterium DG_56]
MTTLLRSARALGNHLQPIGVAPIAHLESGQPLRRGRAAGWSKLEHHAGESLVIAQAHIGERRRPVRSAWRGGVGE